MENNTFRQAEVRETFQEFVVAELYTDDDKAFEELELRLASTVQLPLYVILDPDTEAVLHTADFEKRFVTNPETFVEQLKTGLSAFRILKGR